MHGDAPPARPADLTPSAPLWRRLAAMVYDSLLIVALWFLTGAIYLTLQALVLGPDALRTHAEAGRLDGDPLLKSLLFLATFGFNAYFWRRGGQTLGMQAWRIRLQSREGGRPRWTQCLLRFLGAIVSLLPLGLGYWWSLWDRNGRCWHDHYSMTDVVLLPPSPKRRAGGHG